MIINMNIPEVMARMIMECHMRANHIADPFKIKLSTNKAGGEEQKGGCCGGDSKKKKDK